ncbi:EAL domain-containing protein [Thalassotalea sp. M1531]|uniref:EAL domain-containing protein n=1 Tax=Thalassotalea algicola TaxID=2716224 RepID=A0A7Y0Q8K0_9GAMM|nr:EAL domain-containing protein [Thalassotalea algicola]NMP33543.1 EAL domain-containing protein [Thalassotalea algicola]
MEFLNPRSWCFSKYFSLITIFFGFSFSAQASESIFSFVDFNIAFVLGLSLPILLLSVLIRRIIPNPWWYFAGLTLSALGFLYSLLYLSQYQAPALLSSSTIMLTLVGLWAFATTKMHLLDKESEFFNSINLGQKILVVVGLANIAMLWLLPQIDAYLIWLVFGGALLFIYAAYIAILAKLAPEQVVRSVCLWLVLGVFVGVMFFYLHARVEQDWLIISFIACYMMTLVNGNWGLTQQVYQLINDKNVDGNEQLTPEQLFSFTHDPATNLPSYQQAIMRFEQLIKQNSNQSFAVVVIKPRNFEHVNRVLGHQNSDILLLQLAYCLKRAVSQHDYLMNFDFSDVTAKLARLPSLHFMLAIDLNRIDHDKESVISELCRQLTIAVPPAMSFKSFSLKFELCFGVAYTSEHGQSLHEVIAHAGDAVMEAEKNNLQWSLFNNQVSLYTEQQLLRMERLKQDIQNDGLIWQLAPQINIENKQISGFSLLAKWRDSGSLLELDDFIEVAEQSGEVHSLSKKMLVQAFKALFELKKLNIYQPIGIRLSSQELLEPDLADFIELQIAKYNISARYLIIQMSENVMQVACDRAKHMIDQLKSLEVRICISDFDGSYESLRYIRKLSVDQLNITCDVLSKAESGSAEKAIINSLISLARTMKMSFIGTNIHTKEALNHYQLMGGLIGEGDVMAPNINISEIEDWVDNWFKSNPSADTRNSLLDI